jgi:hypothetical protein
MRHFYYIFLILISTATVFSQVGIGTTVPDNSAILDISSNDKGILIPRLNNSQKSNITSPSNGLLIFNTDLSCFEYNNGSKTSPNWQPMLTVNNIVSSDVGNNISTGSDGGTYLSSTQHFGKLTINSTGNINITDIPFIPSLIKFTAYTNVDSENLDSDNSVGNNNNGTANNFGSTNGYAIKNGTSINEQCIFIGGNANSINDITRYSSNAHSIGLRYANQNGDSLGKTTATVISFNSNGFTLNVDEYTDAVIVIYEAYR